MSNYKIKNIKGITLVEILIGIVVSSIMMGAMYATYSAVNRTYSQVTDRAKISQTGRDVVGMLMRDVRMAGFKYFGDNIKTTNEHIPILITKSSRPGKCCDQLDIVYGDVKYSDATPPVMTYSRYKITYSGKPSILVDKVTGSVINAYAIYKSKKLWSTSGSSWEVPSGNDKFYNDVKIVDYVVDMEFVPIDEDGLKISPPPTATNSNKDKIYKIKIVDIILTTRSTKPFFKSNITQTIYSLADSNRNISISDRYLRDSVIVSAHARNLGLE